MRVGIFELRDGVTEERAHRFAQAILAIQYPWWRLVPALRNDPDEAVVVKWDALRQNVTGLYYDGSRMELHLSESEADHVVRAEPFVIAHEVGHLVDDKTLGHADRADLLELMHAEEPIRIGHFDHDHPDAGHSVERWRTSEHYFSRVNEAYADLFVAAFAPKLWEGRFPRFVHWTSDLARVRELTLRRPIVVYEDVEPESTHAESIARAAELGLVQGVGGGSFDPKSPLTREQLASVSVRLYDRIMEEVHAELRSQA